MAAITASMVGELRAKTDAPMMECKKALTEADGDMEQAPRSCCASSSAARPARPRRASPPKAWSRRPSTATTGALVEVNCETDFVTKNDIVPGLRATRSPSWSPRRTRPTWPRCRRCRYSQDGFGPTVEDVRKGLIGKIGENMTIRRFKRYAGGGKLASYLHGTRIGVMVEFEGDDDGGQGRGDARGGDEAGGAVVGRRAGRADRDRAHGRDAKAAEDAEKAKAEGKPVQSAEIVAKRVEGSVQKYLKEVSLFNQAFVKNDKQTVEQMLKARRHDGQGLHAVRGRRGHREEGRRLRGRSGGAGRGGQGRLSRHRRFTGAG